VRRLPPAVKQSFSSLFRFAAKAALIITGAALILYSLNVSRLWSKFDIFVFIPGILGLLIITAVILLKLIKKILIKIPKVIKFAVLSVFCTGVLSFIIVQGIIFYHMNGRAALNDTDYVIVLGCQIDGINASAPLIRRVNTAIEYLNKHQNAKVIVTGGQGPGEDITEAQAMKKLLRNNGINEDKILTEERASNTMENFLFSDELYDLKEKNILIVTTDYHMFRSLCAAKKLGYQNVSGLSSKSQLTVLPVYLLREYVGIIYYLILGRI